MPVCGRLAGFARERPEKGGLAVYTDTYSAKRDIMYVGINCRSHCYANYDRV